MTDKQQVHVRHFYALMHGGYGIYRLAGGSEAQQLFVLGACAPEALRLYGGRAVQAVCDALDAEAAKAEDAVPDDGQEKADG